MAFDAKKDLRDRDSEKEGVWMIWDEDTSFLVARKTNPKYKQFISKKFRENEQLISSDTATQMADTVSAGIMLEGMATYLLLDWKGVLSGGKAVKYSPEVAKEILEEHDDLYRLIDEFSNNRSNYILKQDKKDANQLEK